MITSKNGLLKKVDEKIYVGNKEAAKDNEVIKCFGITTILNLTGEGLDTNVGVFNYALPSQELLPTEQQKTVSKLEIIASDIQSLKDNENIILIACADGKNQSILAVGYYLIAKCGRPYAATIKNLETLYFTDQQKVEDLEEIARIEASSDPDVPIKEISQDELKLRSEQLAKRRAIQCLTMASFSKLLRMAGGAKK